MPVLDQYALFDEGWRERARTYEPGQWAELATVLVDTFGSALHRTLCIVDDESCFGDDFLSVDVRTSDLDASALALACRGIVGAQIVKDRLDIRAWLFLYSQSSVVRAEGGTHIEFECGRDGWSAIGWRFGELGEFDAFLTSSVEPE